MNAIGTIVVPLLFILGLAVVAAGAVFFGSKLRSGEPITSLPHADGHMANNVTMYSRLKSALDRRTV